MLTRNDDTAIITMPRIATIRGVYLAAITPAGIWNNPIPINRLALISPSKEISLLNSSAIRGKIGMM
jgi:hypothetical protein